ncbi:MAG TPA: D-aminoacyl-tRNA deacylase, partial [Pyrinomonadaceae bacterium]|nr:D-aminoacyl-tRNA deacylase [Pyrinomonadaceae bacterium]
MRAVVQRVTRASVAVEGRIVGEIGKGLVVLLGVRTDDSEKDAVYLADKTCALRVFDDHDGRMNLSVKNVEGGIFVISQFTLYGDVRRGLRPSWTEAALPEIAEPLYECFVTQCRTHVDQVATGSFRKMM